MSELFFRVTGFVASLLLTLAAYFMITQPEFFHVDAKTTIIVIFGLAMIQALIQLLFFINVWKEKGTFWNAGIFVSTVSIIFVVVFFSVWIMNHLNTNMMP